MAATETDGAKPTSILDDPIAAETALLALIQARTDTLISYASGADALTTNAEAKQQAALVTYARSWLKLVGQEIRAELSDSLRKTRLIGTECTITLLGPIRDAANAHWLTIKTKEVVTEDGDDAPDPVIMHTLILLKEHDVVFYISGYQPDRRGDKFRAIAMDAEALRQGLVQPPRMLPPGSRSASRSPPHRPRCSVCTRCARSRS